MRHLAQITHATPPKVEEDAAAIPRRRFMTDVTISVPTLRPVKSCALHVIGGQDHEHGQVPLPEGTLVIGSAVEADLRLMDRTVSGRHCALRNQGGQITVRDLGSKNGTWLQGVRVASGELRVGQHLRVGRVTLLLLEGEGRISLEPGEVLPGVVGSSPEMRRLAEQVRLLAQTDLTVLVVGQTGTGKELVARAVHSLSRRAGARFYPQNCGALPEHLVESELFGHERGAFTGAQETRPGLFETAVGGTLFLDEIGELPLVQQPKLLRVLESRQVRRLGGRELIHVDVRVVTATHADLPERIRQGRFRRDLYYRLGEAVLEVPPLEARRADIPLLVRHFIEELEKGSDQGRICTEGAPMELLQVRDYPGNVRELRNLVRRASALGWNQALRVPDEGGVLGLPWQAGLGTGQGDPVGGAAQGAAPSRAAEEPQGYSMPLARIQDQVLMRAYRAAAGNRAQAARGLGMAKSTYNDRLRRLLSGKG